MKLKEIIENCDLRFADKEIQALAFDSRKVVKDTLFFCLRGTQDGHEYAAEAAQAGATVLVVERALPLDLPQIVVADTRSALAEASARFFGNPAKRMRLVGITGTNGKTTTSYIVKSILEQAGERVGLIGTNAVVYAGKEIPSVMTTPDPIELHGIFRDMLEAGVTTVVMEVSAHALALRKLDGIRFSVAAFTNLSRDHLDFFGDMQTYAGAKKTFFTKVHARHAVVNVDDELGREIAAEARLPVFTYGCHYPADAFAIDLKMSVGGLAYILNLDDDITEVKFSLPGRFNMYNTLCAAAIAKVLGIELKDIIGGIKRVKKVEGRFNIINTTRGCVIIDFAHTDDGLKNILSTIREFATGKIITVFGCGGNRDKTKRPIMGRIVCEYADYCIITSDNPRLEKPEAIIGDIVAGIKEAGKENYCIEPDRKTAIVKALKGSERGDIVLIAGKGAERYQDVSGVKEPYNDEEYVLGLIEGNELSC